MAILGLALMICPCASTLFAENHKDQKKKDEPKPSTRVLVDVQPGNIMREDHRVEAEKDEGISGELPKDWFDDSSWADVKVHYQMHEGNKKKDDDNFLRAKVSDWKRGQAQVRIDLPKSGDELNYEVVFEARSPTYNDLVMHLRQRKAPYRSYASTRVSLTPQWRQYAERWTIREEKQDLALLLDLGRKGIVDLRKLHVRRLNDEAFRREMIKAAEKGPGAGNLLRQTRFPLGLPAGWAISPELAIPEDLTIAPDTGAASPEEVRKVAGNSPPLRVVTTPMPGPKRSGVPEPRTSTVQIYSAPFGIPRPDTPYTGSVFIKGDCSGVLEVFADGRGLKRSGFRVKPEDDWKRVSVTFEPDVSRELYVLAIQGRGEFWLDGVMVAPGGEPQPFVLQEVAELHLSLGAGPNVVFGLEPADVTVQVLNAPENAVMKARVFDLYGNDRGLEPLSLMTDRMIFPVPTFPDTPYGSVRLEAWIENRQGQRISPYAELLFTRLREPRHWLGDAPDSPFGAHFYPTPRQIRAAKAVGVNWARLQGPGGEISSWMHVQPEKDQWVWRDDLVDRYRRRHISLLGVWFTTPLWATKDGPDDYISRESREFRPADIGDFTRYAAQTALHYGKDIQHWQLWQDPGGYTFFEKYDAEAKNWRDRWVQAKGGPWIYQKMVQSTWDRLQREAPFAKIVGLNAGWNSATREWTQRMAELNVPGYCGILGLSTFWGADRGEFVDPNGDFQARLTNDFLQPLRQTYGTLPNPVWVTQASPTFDVDNLGFYRRTVLRETPPDEGTLFSLADRIPRFTVNLLSQGVEKLFLDSMANSRFLGDKDGQPFLTLVTEDLALNPGAGAHSAMAWFLEDRDFVMVQEIQPQVFVYFFENSEEQNTVAVIIPTDLADPWQLKTGGHNPEIAVFDLFGNPVADGPRPERTVTYAEIPLPTRQAYPHLKQVIHQ